MYEILGLADVQPHNGHADAERFGSSAPQTLAERRPAPLAVTTTDYPREEEPCAS